MINWDKLNKIQARARQLEELLADATIIEDQAQYQKFAKEFASLSPLVEAFKEFEALNAQVLELKKLLEEKQEKEFESLIRDELLDLESKKSDQEKKLDEMLNPRPIDKDTGVIIEIRAGTGGQ